MIVFDLTTPIESAADAVCFIVDLDRAGLLFHFDDDPASIVNSAGGRIFTDEQCPLVSVRVAELFEHLADPFAVALQLIPTSD